MPCAEIKNPEPNPVTSWSEYWNQDMMWTGSKIWEINAERFLRATEPILGYSKTDQVLDIGCGPGHIAECVAPLTGSLIGIDPAENLLTLATRRCQKLSNASFRRMAEGRFDFQNMGRFSLFLCVSVIQYFPDEAWIYHLVHSASQAAFPGARMLIADIPEPRTPFQIPGDLWASFAQSLREGYCLHCIQTLLQMPFSAYKKFSGSNLILEIKARSLAEELSKKGFQTSVINQSVSICAHRPSLLIQF